MFLPQETYVCGGEATLRDLVRYPGVSFDDDDETSDEPNDDDVRDALNAAGLQRLLLLYDADWVTVGRSAFSHPSQGARSVFQNQKIIDALDVVRDWTVSLSPGERQRVAFARLFLRRRSVLLHPPDHVPFGDGVRVRRALGLLRGSRRNPLQQRCLHLRSSRGHPVPEARVLRLGH